MATDAPAGSIEHYRTRLTVMRDRLAGQIGDQKEQADRALEGSTGDGILHTHNADMDTEGLDAAVGKARSLHDELDEVEGALNALSDLEAGGDTELTDEARARYDALLSTQDFAEEMDRKYGVKADAS